MKKTSLFSRIQSWFKDDHDGRWLGVILAEIGHQRPQTIADLLHEAFGWNKPSHPHLVLDPEWSFHVGGSSRRADLAVFDESIDGEPIAFIEIKYHDGLLPKTDLKRAQEADYLAWKEAKEGRNCLVLSRATLTVAGLSAMTWTQAARVLRKSSNNSDLVKALVEHLQEEGVVMQNIKPRPLIGFIKRLVCPVNGNGGRLSDNLTGPQEFGKLLQNVKLLSNRFNGLFKDAWKRAGIAGDTSGEGELSGSKVASVDFEVNARLKGARERMVDEDDGSINSSARAGGSVSVFARHALGNEKGWLRIGYGIWLDVDGSASHEKGRHPKTSVYAWANCAEFAGDWIEFEHKLSSFDLITVKAEDSMDKLESHVRSQLHKVIVELLERAKSLTPKQRKAAKLLLASFAK